jgi:hypothetical protein
MGTKSADLPARIVAIWPELAAQLPPPWEEPPIAAARAGVSTNPTGRVWKLQFERAPPLALKLAHTSAPLALEAQALAALGRQRCPVPRVIATSGTPSPRWIALEWCGDLTLDDLAHDAPVEARERLGLSLATAVAAVELAFAPFDVRWRASASETAARTAALTRQTSDWVDAAPPALAWLLDAPLDHGLGAALSSALAPATSAQPTLGSLDYNAHNVVIDGERLTLIDFAAVGADWPVRRFVQYGTATGAGPRSAGFASVIHSASTAKYARLVAPLHGTTAADVQWRVDAHDVLLLLIAAHHLRMIESGGAHPDRVATWTNVPRRRAQLSALLVRQLASDGPAEDFRARLRRW